MPITRQMIVITWVWYSSKSDWNVFHSYKCISFLKLCLKHKMFENQDSLLLVFRHFAEVITIAIQSDFVKLQTKKNWYLFNDIFLKFSPKCHVQTSWIHMCETSFYVFLCCDAQLGSFWLHHLDFLFFI